MTRAECKIHGESFMMAAYLSLLYNKRSAQIWAHRRMEVQMEERFWIISPSSLNDNKMRMGFIPQDITNIENVHILKNGHFLDREGKKWRRDGRKKMRRQNEEESGNNPSKSNRMWTEKWGPSDDRPWVGCEGERRRGCARRATTGQGQIRLSTRSA